MLAAKGLSIWYNKGANIINDASFTLPPNVAVGLLGVNGAGKTTLVNYLSGVHKNYSVQTIAYNEKPVPMEDDAFKTERYTVFTEEQAFSYWSFEEYLPFIHGVYGRQVDTAVVDELIAGFEFGQYTKYKIRGLSTGNRKKVFLITGFALRLPLLILDEPLDGLDFQSSEYLYAAINTYKFFGTVLMSSHIAESFEKTCDTILLLDKGRITEKALATGTDIRTQLAGWLHGDD